MAVKEQNPFTGNAEAFGKFKAMPMPMEKEEAWRYTEIEKLNLGCFEPFESKTTASFARLSSNLAEKGVILADINEALEKCPAARKYFFKNKKTSADKFVALSSAYPNSGVFLYVPKDVEIECPIMANFYSEGKSSILCNLIVLEPNSRVDFVEEYSNSESAHEQLNVCTTEVFANEGSKINFFHLNSWTEKVNNITNIFGAAGRNAAITWAFGCFGGKLNRVKIDTTLAGNGSRCCSAGAFIGRGTEHVDITTNIYHNAENTKNETLVRGVLSDKSSSVYRGLIRIKKNAQKSDSYIANHVLKLGDKTLANCIPSLKIDANDVRAGHGVTVGGADEGQLFYMAARGLAREPAEKLIAEGFFEPVIKMIHKEKSHKLLKKYLHNGLA